MEEAQRLFREVTAAAREARTQTLIAELQRFDEADFEFKVAADKRREIALSGPSSF